MWLQHAVKTNVHKVETQNSHLFKTNRDCFHWLHPTVQWGTKHRTLTLLCCCLLPGKTPQSWESLVSQHVRMTAHYHGPRDKCIHLCIQLWQYPCAGYRRQAAAMHSIAAIVLHSHHDSLAEKILTLSLVVPHNITALHQLCFSSDPGRGWVRKVVCLLCLHVCSILILISASLEQVTAAIPEKRQTNK